MNEIVTEEKCIYFQYPRRLPMKPYCRFRKMDIEVSDCKCSFYRPMLIMVFQK